MKTILTVDDSLSVRQMVGLALRQMGHETIEAADGAEALQRFAVQPVHMVITDLNMPRLNGIELVRRLRASPAGRLIPIVMLTTESQPEMKQQGKAAGATGWIVKPFTREQLTLVVKRLLR
ncbi:MAG: response regulator [Opitutales bacterium]